MDAITTTKTFTAGRFTLTNGQITGPAEYLREQGDARIRRMLAGTDETFKIFCQQCPNVETAIVVLLQTDYAAWLGAREAMGWMKGGR